jgi:hypothetical protein
MLTTGTSSGSSDVGGAAGDRREDASGLSTAKALKMLVRFSSLFALGVVAGLLLGACGGGGGDGSALPARTGLSATRPAETRVSSTEAVETVEPTTPVRTVGRTTTRAEEAVETTTAAITTTPELTPPTALVTVTTTETQTQTETETETPTSTRTAIIITPTVTTPPPTTTVVPATTSVPSTTTVVAVPEPSSSTSDWAWIALAIALLAALVIGLIVWRRHRSGLASWSAQSADLGRRSLLALDDVLARGSVVTGAVQALAAEAQSLEARAPDEPSKASAGLVRARLDDLAATLEADRKLRLSSPPPSEEQLSYSGALIRQQVEQLQQVLLPSERRRG